MNRFSRRLGLALSVLLLFPLSSYSQSSNHQAISLYNLGLTAYKEGSPESAIIFFKRAADLDPNLADAQYNLGVIYQAEKRYRDAIPRFQEVLRIKPGDPDAHYQLALILQETGQLADAREHFSNIAPSYPHFGDAQSRIAQINSQLSRTQSQPMIQSTQPLPTQAPAAPTQRLDEPHGQTYPQAYTPVAPASTSQMQPDRSVPPTDQPDQRSPSDFQKQISRGLSYPALGAAGQTSVSARETQLTDGPSSENTAVIPQPVQTTPVPPANPITVLPNTSCRVIATGFAAPAGLAFDHLGNLYVANFTTNEIDRISPDGTKALFSRGANVKGPIGLAADDAGNLYVANYPTGTIARISPAGVSSIIGTGFKKPYYLTFDHEGNLYVSQQEDNTIVRVALPNPAGRVPASAKPASTAGSY